MKAILRYSFFALIGASLFTSCIDDKVEVINTHYTDQEYEILKQHVNLPAERDQYSVTLPQHMMDRGAFPPVINDAKATLGRVLFYDTKLSSTEETSCASCHDQALAFSDDKAFSEGINGQVTDRNSLPLASTANFSSSYGGGGGGPDFGGPIFIHVSNIGFFWDERASSIADQSSQSIQNTIEMGMDLDELTAKLSQQDYYRILYRKAFGDETVTTERTLGAIQEFVNAFVSTDSKFDEGLNAMSGNAFTDFPNFTAQENRGRELYINNCTSCHASDMSSPTGTNMANNGLDMIYADKGLGDRTGEETHNGIFKVPFLRNVALTAPYMHDGRFNTLEEVVEHYSSNVQNHPNLSFALKADNNEARKFDFSSEDKAALVAFLNTVTDHSFVEQKRYSSPF